MNKEAIKNEEYMWELKYDFPYEDVVFVRLYKQFFVSLEKGDSAEIIQSRLMLKQHLKNNDYEYLVWQEWKEGFARSISHRTCSEITVLKMLPLLM